MTSRYQTAVPKIRTKRERAANAGTALSVPERLLLLCVASGIDFKHAKIAERVMTDMLVKGLLECDSGGQLTGRGRVVPQAVLPDL